jgi:hypothetical protein
VFRDVFRPLRAQTVAKRRQWRSASLMLMCVLAAGCAGMGGLTKDSPPEAKREAVAARAKARWDALIRADLAGAYEYLSPASRAATPLDLYRSRHKVGLYRAVKVDDVNCEGEACTVKLSVTYDYKRFKGVTTLLTEKWIITQGQAWFVDNG